MPEQQPSHIGASALVRFISELGMLAALAYAGAVLADGVPSILLAIVLPLLGVLAWGAWAAPRAKRRWPDPARLILELVLFGAAAAGLVVVGAWPWAGALVVAYVAGLPHRQAEAGYMSTAS